METIGRILGVFLIATAGASAAIWLPAAAQIAVEQTGASVELRPEGPAVADQLDRLGREAEAHARFQDAEDHYRRALEIREAALGPYHLATAQSCLNLGALFVMQRDGARAELYLGRVLSIVEHPAPADDPDWPLARLAMQLRGDPGRRAWIASLSIAALNELASLHREAGRLAQARPLMDRAISMAEGPTVTATTRISVLANAGLLAHDLGNYEEAESRYRRALDALADEGPSGDPLRAGIWNNLASLQLARNRYADARDSLERARAFLGTAAAEPELAALLASNAAQLERHIGPTSPGALLEP
jgi:tetratricopeptide (TPR) repeat protein